MIIFYEYLYKISILIKFKKRIVCNISEVSNQNNSTQMFLQYITACHEKVSRAEAPGKLLQCNSPAGTIAALLTKT